MATIGIFCCKRAQRQGWIHLESMCKPGFAFVHFFPKVMQEPMLPTSVQKKKCYSIKNTAQIKTQIPLILKDHIGAVHIALFHFNNCVHSELNKLEAQVA